MPDAPEHITDAAPVGAALPAKRKRRSGSEKRQRATGPVLVRLLPEERAAVEERAATAGLTVIGPMTHLLGLGDKKEGAD